MKIYLAAEGGGSKLIMVLFDENGNIIGTEKMCGTNERYHPIDEIAKEAKECVERLIPRNITFVDRVDYAIVGNADPFIKAVSERVKVETFSKHGEGVAALAVTGKPYGIVAQAGTGSDAFFLQKEKTYTIGGYGPYFGDEGSGYDIGIKAVRAAIYSEDGRGPKTILPELVKDYLNVNSLWDVVIKFINNPKTRQEVASISRVVSIAAARGDEVSLNIYKNAAHELALQVITAIRRNNGIWEGPIVTSGGTWKGSRYMFNTFSDEIKREYPNAEVVFPTYDPIVGCVFLGLTSDGFSTDKAMDFIEKYFGYFRIDA